MNLSMDEKLYFLMDESDAPYKEDEFSMTLEEELSLLKIVEENGFELRVGTRIYELNILKKLSQEAQLQKDCRTSEMYSSLTQEEKQYLQGHNYLVKGMMNSFKYSPEKAREVYQRYAKEV